MKNLTEKILGAIIIGLVLFLGLKSCVVSTIHIEEYILLQEINESGQIDNIVLTPQEEMVFTKTLDDIVEVAYYDLVGHKATHYFLGLYNIGTFPFGLRYYNNAEQVMKVEMQLLKKRGESFPAEGKTYSANIIIFEDHAIVGKHRYKRTKLNQYDQNSVKLNVDRIISELH